MSNGEIPINSLDSYEPVDPDLERANRINRFLEQGFSIRIVRREPPIFERIIPSHRWEYVSFADRYAEEMLTKTRSRLIDRYGYRNFAEAESTEKIAAEHKIDPKMDSIVFLTRSQQK